MRNHESASRSRSEQLTNAVCEVLTDASNTVELSESIVSRLRQTIADCLGEQVRDSLTPPQLASELGVSPDKVLCWIHSGELQAANLATTQGGRPRYRIDRKSVESFKRMRANQSPPPTQTRRKKTPAGVIEFF